MAYSRRTIENPSDRVQLEQGEARVLFATWQATGKKVLTVERMEFIERRYGRGAVERVTNYMKQMKDGELL